MRIQSRAVRRWSSRAVRRCSELSAAGALVLLCHKLRRERPFVFAPQHGQRDKMATSLAMSRRRKVEIELGT